MNFLYRFSLFRQKYKFLNNFKLINKTAIKSFKNFNLKKFYLNLKKIKSKKFKKKITGKDLLQVFRKYQSFKKFKKITKNVIPNFFLNKKK
jgi:hypothetical protein